MPLHRELAAAFRPPPHKFCWRRTMCSPRQYEGVGCGGRCHCGGERREPRAREGVDGPMRALAALGAGYGRRQVRWDATMRTHTGAGAAEREHA